MSVCKENISKAVSAIGLWRELGEAWVPVCGFGSQLTSVSSLHLRLPVGRRGWKVLSGVFVLQVLGGKGARGLRADAEWTPNAAAS